MPGLSQTQFLALYDAYHGALYRYLLVRVGRVEAAQDLTSETFLKAWRSLSKKGPVQYEKAYLYRVAGSVLADYYRKSANEVSADHDFLIQTLDDSLKSATIGDLADPVQMARVHKVLQTLPPLHAEVITLRYVEDLPHADIAQVVGKSEGAVRVLVTRALKELREKLEAEERGV